METGELIFVTGGVRSGKSSFAEEYAASEANTKAGNLHYIATSKPADEEMVNRIKRHQRDRERSGTAWKTWEWPVDLHEIVPHFKQSDIVLLDCLTILLSNELFRYKDPGESCDKKKIYDAIIDGIVQLTNVVNTLIIVSNEVLTEPMSDEKVVKSYSHLLGKLHQAMVNRAEKAYLVEAGIPILKKERP
ncbi:bifunctional adenosylcobinamide kinase/adenosylcobinamide-phosphate guanylyltransferase [Virgibacillus oceani]